MCRAHRLRATMGCLDENDSFVTLILISSFRTSSLLWSYKWLIFNQILIRKIVFSHRFFLSLWILARHCIFNNRVIKHGYKLSDPLCTGVVSCCNGRLNMEYCPKIPDRPTDCARPKLKTINVPGKCCKKLWVCSGNWKNIITVLVVEDSREHKVIVDWCYKRTENPGKQSKRKSFQVCQWSYVLRPPKTKRGAIRFS